MNDKSKNRIELIKENLDRLKFKTEIFNYDVLKLESKEKYDFIILDAPCSALGTIRKNPGIFKKRGLNLIIGVIYKVKCSKNQLIY